MLIWNIFGSYNRRISVLNLDVISKPDLVRRIVEIAGEEGRRIATVDETRRVLGLE